MNYSTLDKYKIPIIVGSLVLSALVIGGTYFYRLRPLDAPPTFAELSQPILIEISSDEYYRGKNITLKGLSVKRTNKGLFLVFADLDVDGAVRQRRFLAQKYNNGTVDYWQVSGADADRLKALGISINPN